MKLQIFFFFHDLNVGLVFRDALLDLMILKHLPQKPIWKKDFCTADLVKDLATFTNHYEQKTEPLQMKIKNNSCVFVTVYTCCSFMFLVAAGK